MDHTNRAEEDLERLGKTSDTRKKRDRQSPQPVGAPTAVPVLVQGADGVSGSRRQPQQLGDLRAALTTRLHQLTRASLHRHGDDLEGPPEGRTVWHHVPGNVLERLSQAGPVGRLQIALDGAVISSEQVADLRGVAGTAEILQQERIEQG
jgi:hypothetical protein